MKVLQLLPSLEVGGVERGVIDLARAMTRLGHQTIVISSGGQLVSDLEKMGVAHYQLPIHRKSLLTLGLVPKVVGIIQRERIDLVHARSRVPAWVGWFAARRAGVPFITTCHGYYSLHPLSSVMGWGKKVIVISRVVGRRMIDDFGVPPERIRLVHRGIDLSKFPLDPDYYNQPRKIYRITNIARLSPIKGQIEFLKAVHRLRRQLPHVEVWLVGSEGKGKHKYTDALHQTIRQLGLESCVQLLGTRRDIAELLRQSDLAVLSTLVPEAFGRVILEAGAVGRAVVATAVGGVLDIIEDGKNGRLVPPGDITAMADAIYTMLMNRPLCATYARNLRQKIEQCFTVEQMVAKTLAVYEEALQEKKILVMKLGSAGDVILATPTLRMIRERYPHASISFLVDKQWAPLISSSPRVNEIILLMRKKLWHPFYLLRLAKKLRREGFDISVDLQNSKWTHWIAFLAGIGQRYGFARGLFGFLLNRPDCGFDAKEPPVKNQFRIISKLGVTHLDETLELWPNPQAEKRVLQALAERGVLDQDRLVGFVLGASPRWLTKRWPVEKFQALSDLILQQNDCKIVLIGTASDEPLLPLQWQEKGDRILNFLGKTSLEEMVALIGRLDVLVTGDTAPLHVASARKTKVVALFGPTDPIRHMPPAEKAVVLVKHLPCQPCYSGRCRHSEKLACLERISVKEVYEAVEGFLKEGGPLLIPTAKQ